jgi:hypothetical protein
MRTRLFAQPYRFAPVISCANVLWDDEKAVR